MDTCGAAFFTLGGGLGPEVLSLATGAVMLAADLLGEALSMVDIEFFFFMKEGSFLIWTLDRGQFWFNKSKTFLNSKG